jgi:hypothetical protein
VGANVIRLVGALVLVAAGVSAALLAADVHAWRSAVHEGDIVYVGTPTRAQWTADANFGGTAEHLLGVADDIDFRRALQRFVEAGKLRPRLDNAVDVESDRGRAQDALERAARETGGARRSQALTLLGVLAFGAAASGSSQSQVDAAISDFTDALRADPGDSDAAFDLELLLRLTAAHGSRVEPGQGGGFGRTGRHGAGGGQPGSGY